MALYRLLQRRERYAKSFEMAPRRILILILELGYEPTTNKALSPFGVAQPAIEKFGSEKEFVSSWYFIRLTKDLPCRPARLPIGIEPQDLDRVIVQMIKSYYKSTSPRKDW